MKNKDLLESNHTINSLNNTEFNDKCPSCEENTYSINKGKCINPNCLCGYDGKYLKKRIKKTSNNLSNLLTKRPKFNYLNYKVYEIGIENGKVKNIKFSFKLNNGKIKKFIVYIDYEFTKEIKKETIFHEVNQEDRYRENKIITINNLRINAIQKKVKSGYGEIKKSANYFKYIGLKQEDLKVVIINFLKNYH